MNTPAYSNDELNLCSVCFTQFEIYYSEEQRRWMLVDCIKSEGLLYHPSCVKDAWKGLPVVQGSIDPHIALVKTSPNKIYVPEDVVCDCTQCDHKKPKTCSLI